LFFAAPLRRCAAAPSKIVEQIKPIKFYNSFMKDRLQLIKDQKDKTGVYCLISLKNGNIYICSRLSE
jgi:hypothetical protein